MQKKIFTSLLMSPIAFGALANVDIEKLNNDGWTPSGVAGTTNPLLVKGEGGVTGKVGLGVIEYEVTVDYPGTYVVNFDSPDNLKLTVKGIASESDKSVTFSAVANEKVVIYVEAANAAKDFYFVASSLQIDYKFDTEKNAMLKSLDDAATPNPVVEVTLDNAAAKAAAEKLVAAAKAFTEEKKPGILKEINAIASEDQPNDVKLKSYIDNKLYENPNPIQEKIEALVVEAADLNASIDLFNENYEALVGLTGGFDTLEENLKAQNDRITADALIVGCAADLDAEDKDKAVAYVADQCASTSESIAAALKAYKEEVSKAYVDLETEIDFKPTKDAKALQEQINKFAGLVDKSIQSVADYSTVFGVEKGYSATLGALWTKANGDFNKISGVEGFADIYNVSRDQELQKISSAKNEADKVFRNTTFANASDPKIVEANSKAYDEAKDALEVGQGVVDSWKQRNIDMRALQSYYDAFSKKIAEAEAEAEGIGLSESEQEQYDPKKALADEKVQEYLNAINAAYSALDEDFDETAYGTKSELYKAANKAVEDLSDFMSDFGYRIQAYGELQNFKTYLAESEVELIEDGVTPGFLEKMFGSNLASLEAAIKNIEDEETYNAVIGAISNVKSFAATVVTALTDAHSALDKFDGGVKTLKTNCTTSYLVNGKKFDAYSTVQADIVKFDEQSTKWHEKYQTITKAEDPQQCFTDAESLKTSVTAPSWQTSIDNAYNYYMNSLVTDNYNCVNDALTTIKAAVTPGTLDKKSDVTTNFNKAESTLSALNEQKSQALKDNPDKANKATLCTTYVKALQGIWTPNVGSMMDNVELKDEFDKTINGQLNGYTDDKTGEFIDPYNDLYRFVTTAPYSASLAKDYYKKIVEDLKAQFEKQLGNIQTSLDGMKLVSDQDSFRKAIDDLSKKNGLTGTIHTEVIENESAYKAQLQTYKSTRNLIIDLLAEVESYQGAVVGDIANKWIAPLNKLLNEDLEKVKAEMESSCKDGKSLDNRNTILGKYTKISEDAQAIVDEFNDKTSDNGWAATVREHNKKFTDDASEWSDLAGSMESTYLAAIGAYNAYVDLNNKSYKDYGEFITAVNENSAELFDLQSDYQTLILDVRNYIATANAEMHAVTDEEFDAEAIVPAKALIKKMADEADDLIKQFDSAAVHFYEGTAPNNEGWMKKADDKLTGTATKLEGSPYNYKPTEIKNLLKTYQEAFDNGVKLYNKTPKNGKLADYKKTIGYVMGAVADSLDKAMAINLNAEVLAKKWDPKYEEVKGSLDQLAIDIETYYKGGATSSVYNQWKPKFVEAFNKATGLNDNVQTYKGDLLEDVEAKISDLEGYLKDAETAVGKVKASMELQNMESQFYNDMVDAKNQLAALDEMPVQLGGLAKAGLNTSLASDKVDNFIDTLGYYNDPDDDNVDIDDVKYAKDLAYNTLNTTLAGAALKEQTYLEGYLEILKVAYNDARANNPTEEYKDEYQLILKYSNDVANLLVINPTEEPDDQEKRTPIQFLEFAKDLEQNIGALIDKLQKLAPKQVQTLNANLTTLNSQYSSIESAVNSGKANVANIKVEDKRPALTAEYENILTKLKAIQEAYKAAGADVVTQMPVYANQMKFWGDSVPRLNNKVNIAITQANYYTELMKTQNGYREKYNEFNALQSELGVYVSNDFSWKLYKNEDILNELYAENKLTSETKLTYDLSTAIPVACLNAYVAKAVIQRDAAGAEIDRVYEMLRESTSVSDNNYDITNVLSDLSWDMYINGRKLDVFSPDNLVLEDKYTQGVKDITDIIAEYDRILATAQEQYRIADQRTYELGDLNDDGECDILDAQMMNKLILEGTTFQDLVDRGKSREAFAADIVPNGKINIADYTALINMILKETFNPNYPKKISGGTSFFDVRNSIESTGFINVVLAGEENGIRTYAVEISDSEAFVAGQIDFLVESSASIVGVRGADRLYNHDVQFAKLGDATRVVITSDDNSLFEGNGTVTLYVDVQGRSGLGFQNAIFAAGNAQAYTFANKAIGTTAIDSIIDGAKAVKEAVYDAAGRVKKSISRGINIIRNSNGTVTKEIRK